MRHYDKGVLVGEVDPPIDFEQWLRTQLEHAEHLDGVPVSDEGVPGEFTTGIAYTNGRRQTLKEVQLALEDSRRTT